MKDANKISPEERKRNEALQDLVWQDTEMEAHWSIGLQAIGSGDNAEAFQRFRTISQWYDKLIKLDCPDIDELLVDCRPNIATALQRLLSNASTTTGDSLLEQKSLF